MTPHFKTADWPRAWYRADCRDCSRLSKHLEKVKRAHSEYHCKPVAPIGPRDAELLIVGLAPGLRGANRTGRPFTGDAAGDWLYKALHEFGYCSIPQSSSLDDISPKKVGRAISLDAGLVLHNCRITNAVKCLPPKNKPDRHEVAQCNHYLAAELAEPHLKCVLALGRRAHRATLSALGLVPSHYEFKHNRRYDLPKTTAPGDLTQNGGHSLILIDSYHCSRRNTNTRLLTTAMFEQVFDQIAKLAEPRKSR